MTTTATSNCAAAQAAPECREEGFLFGCAGAQLVGVISAPPVPAVEGVLIVVGGPQYRGGSHRQFVHLARALAAQGIACMRFDCRGMGDSEGDRAGFEGIGADIRSAVDAFMARCPSLVRLALWGLCDGASAICFYAGDDTRVRSVVLVNPWVRTESGEARAQLRHYYVGRLLDRGFWSKLLKGKVDLSASTGSLLRAVRRTLGGKREPGRQAGGGLPERMAAGLSRFGGRILFILSGNDLTAKEFADACRAPAWSTVMRRAACHDFPEADHTFSTGAHKDDVARLTARWLLHGQEA